MSEPTFEEVLAALKNAGEYTASCDFEWLSDIATPANRSSIMQALADLDAAEKLRDNAQKVLYGTLDEMECRWNDIQKDGDEALA